MPSAGASGRRTLVIIAVTVAVLGSTVLFAAAAPELPAGLSAFALLDNAGYAAALGEAVTGPEDDGGVPYEPTGTPGHDSVTRVLGASGLLYTIDLYSLADATTASDLFDQNATTFTASEPIAGAGERAVYSEGRAFVQVGAQIVMITVRTTGAAEQSLETAKEQNGDAGALFDIMQRTVISLAAPLGAKMSGQPAQESSVGLPVDALDPCTELAPALGRQLGLDVVSATVVRSERPPALECRVATDQYSISVFVASEAQLLAALVPETAQQRYDRDLAAVAAGGPTQVAVGTAAFEVGAPEVVAEMVTPDDTGAPVWLRAEIGGSPPVPGQENAQADAFLQVLTLYGASLAAGLPAAPPPTEPDLATTTSSAGPTTTQSPTATTVASVQPTIGSATTSVRLHSSGKSSAGTYVAVLIAAIVAGAIVVVVTRRRRRLLAGSGRPVVRSVAGTGRQQITLHVPGLTIGVRAVPGPERHEIRKQEPAP